MMSEVELPEGWVNTLMGTVFTIERGGSPRPIKDFLTQNADGVNWIKIGDTNGVSKYIYETAEKIKPAGVKKSRMVFENDFILSNSMSFGRPYIMKTKGCIHDGWLVIRVDKNIINADYLYYFLTSSYVYNQFSTLAKGSTVKNLNINAVEQVNIFLPPLAEQHEIADRLDSLLAQVDSIKTRLNGVPALLKHFRQAVLAAAVSGQLTEEWRETNDISISDWLKSTLGNLSIVSTGKTPLRSNAKYWENGIVPWLTSAATGQLFCHQAEQFITEQAVKECSMKIFPVGTLLLAMYGEGKTRGQVTELKIKATCNQACAAINVDSSQVLNPFIKIRLQENYEETRKSAVGGAQPNLNLSKVREIVVNLPSINEQTEIVARVETLFAFADQIEARMQAAQVQVNQLTQSILAKAFRGELTAEWRATHPELISGKNSAQSLLARIQAEHKQDESM